MTTILTIEKLKEIAPITNALANQVDMITPFIEVAESMHVRNDILGDALYDAIIDEIEASTLSGSNLTLVEKYIYNLSAWYSFWEASIFIIYRSEAKGITKKYSENSQALDKTELAIYRQSILEKALFWRNLTIDYLQDNKINYPLWRSDTDCDYPTKDNSNGIYV